MEKEKHLLVFSATWCGPCRMMKANVWEESIVKEKLNNFDSVSFIDIDDPDSRQMAMTYKVNAVPMIYIVDQKGIPVKAGSTMDVNQTLKFLS
jgi:thioredoxin 1|tara:strand:- start:598 stop:876 length:279 start_codon:yes stop_codon:yes gene_type:complete